MRKCGLLGLAFLAVALIAFVYDSAAAENKKPSNKDIMKKLNGGPKGLTTRIGKALKAKQPDWDAIQKQTKEFEELVGSLAENAPPKGKRESWEKLTEGYLTKAKALNKAAEEMDLKTAKAAHAKVTGVCLACHTAHKPK